MWDRWQRSWAVGATGVFLLPLVITLWLGGWWGEGRAAASEAGSSASTSRGDDAANPARQLRIVCFGDSLTGHRPGVAYQHQYLKYADLLGLMIEAHPGHGPVKVINSGYAGDGTQPNPQQGLPGAVARVQPDVLDHKPDIVVVLIGGNDRVRNDDDAARTQQNLTRMLTQLQQAEVRVLVLLYPPALPDPDQPDRAWHHLSAKNTIIAGVAAALEMPTLDLGPAMLTAARHHPRQQLVDPLDGVHLRPRGEMVFARAIHARLIELGWLQALAQDPEADD